MTLLQKYEAAEGVEVLINPETGETSCSVSSYALLAGKDKSTISRRLEVLKVELKEAEVFTNGGLQKVKLINENLVVNWLAIDRPEKVHLFIKTIKELTGKNLEYPILSPKLSKRKVILHENLIVRRLIKGNENNVILEAPTKYGRIDILSLNSVIEVKHYKQIHSAIGQVLSYSMEYKDRIPTIVVFGKTLHDVTDLSHWEELCLKYDISFWRLTDENSYINFRKYHLNGVEEQDN